MKGKPRDYGGGQLLRKTLILLAPVAAVAAVALTPVAAKGTIVCTPGQPPNASGCKPGCKVPDLVRPLGQALHLHAAKMILRNRGCGVGKIIKQETDNPTDTAGPGVQLEHGWERGVVVKQSADPGQIKPPGFSVTLVVET